jgi:hypothetical protein
MRFAGMALVALGILALIYGGISYNRQKTVLEVGSLKATATEHKTLPIPPVAGAVCLVGGVVLLTLPRRHA